MLLFCAKERVTQFSTSPPEEEGGEKE